ncbi:MAG: superoxide dismutase family protein [Ruminococcaceae bacterium]|nr:superoxide dismutase family protein [Oscillospiraceae bacterium]
MYYKSNGGNEKEFDSLLRRLPHAVAIVKGSAEYSQINGTVKFYQARSGVLVAADIRGLPVSEGICDSNIFAFHIHGGMSCTGNDDDPFANAGTHYDPLSCPHPYHAGDMPPLFSADGRAFLAFLTNRFTVNEILCKTVVIHDRPDDFTTQPSGNAGNKIACGVISQVKR